MEHDDLVEMALCFAEKHGADVSGMDGRKYESMWCDRDSFEKFVVDVFKAGQEHEREACASLCEDIDAINSRGWGDVLAKRIRARGWK